MKRNKIMFQSLFNFRQLNVQCLASEERTLTQYLASMDNWGRGTNMYYYITCTIEQDL